MCTVNDEYGEASEFIIEEKCQIPDEATCQKCNVTRATVVLRGKDVYCNDCFLVGATHKFRATLGKSKIVRPRDKILVAHSGKAGSTALLHLIRAGMHESVHKRLIFETKVLYIDDTPAKGQSFECSREIIQGIEKQTSSLGFEAYGVSLAQSLNDEELKVETLQQSLSNTQDDFASLNEKLGEILQELPDETSKVELTKKLRYRLYLRASRILGCNKVFLGDDSTSLAVDILSNVSLGRGSQLSHDVGFMDDRYCDLMILRPMRDFTQEELSIYIKIQNLETIEFADTIMKEVTIQGITEKFVIDLNSRFNGTVSTIYRTGEKICSSATKNLDECENCALCDTRLDTSVSETTISAVQATAFSRFVSSQSPKENLNFPKISEIPNSLEETNIESNCCGNCSGSCANGKDIAVTCQDLTKFLCYGCRLIFKNCDLKNVPDCVLSAVRQRLSLESMRKEIGDFLL